MREAPDYQNEILPNDFRKADTRTEPKYTVSYAKPIPNTRKNAWPRLGVGFEDINGKIKIRFDSLPVPGMWNGEIMLFPNSTFDDKKVFRDRISALVYQQIYGSTGENVSDASLEELIDDFVAKIETETLRP